MNVRTFDLNLLRVFAAIEAKRSVKLAAAAIGLSQPAMSNALSRLRKSCADPLFVRTSRGMEPTSLALDMAGPVHDALALIERTMERRSNFDPSRMTRTFRLLMSDAGQLAVLPAIVESFARQARGIVLESIQMPREHYFEALQDGAADLAIGHLTTTRPGLFQQHLFEDTYCCIASTRHPVLRGRISLEQYLAAQHVAIASGAAEEPINRLFAKKRRIRMVSLRVAQYYVATETVRSSSLIAAVPLLTVRDRHDVQILDLPFKVPPAQVRQFWHGRVHLDLANQWLRGRLAMHFQSASEMKQKKEA